VARDNLCGGYRITSNANELSPGDSGISRIIEIARPIAVDLTKRTEWPVGIGSNDNDAICVRFSTAAICKRANAVSLGWRLDLFYTAMGRAYLAFCSNAERERIFKTRIDAGLSTRSDEAKIRALLPQIRDKGFAERAENRTVVASGAAVPIFSKNALLAVMNLSYIRDAVPSQAFHTEIAKPLLDSRDKIEAAIQLEQRASSRSRSLKAQAGAPPLDAIKLEDDLSRVDS
jgi:IclR family mhp operon transcriptional activator